MRATIRVQLVDIRSTTTMSIEPRTTLDGLENVISYFNDIIIFTDSWEDNFKTTCKSVLSRL